MATVFNTDMLIHVWANQSQMEGRRATNTLSFCGRQLTHYRGVCAVHMGSYVVLDGAQCHHTGWNSGNLSYAIERAIHPNKAVYVPSLPGDAASAFNTLANENVHKSDKAWACKVLQGHVAKHIESYSDESAIFVLQLAGVRNPARRKGELRIATEKAREKGKLAEAKRKQKVHLALASQFVQHSPYEIVQYAHMLTKRDFGLAKGIFSYYHIDDFLLEMSRAHKAAKAAKRDALATKVWQRLKAARAHVARCTELSTLFQQNNYWRIRVAEVRIAFESLEAGNVLGSHNLKTAVAAASVLADHMRTPESAKPRLRELYAAWTQALDVQLAAEKAEAFAKQEKDREAWLAGVKGIRPLQRLHDALGGPLLRAVDVKRDDSGAIIGGNLETSHGATVPLPHAVKVFQFVKRCKESGKAWKRNGHTIRVGHFHVDEIHPNGNFRAGCHSINWNEVERVAYGLGVLDVAASDSALEATH